MFRWVSLSVSIFFLASCSEKISLRVLYNETYCGGAPPTEQQFFGENFPYTNEAMILKVFKSEKKTKLKNISLNANGVWFGKVPKHQKLELYQPTQFKSLDQVKKIFDLGENQFYEPLPDETILNWKSSPIPTFDGPSKYMWTFKIQKKCHVGLNPCYKYVGPKPN